MCCYLLECALTLARDLAYVWPRCPHQYYMCATPPSFLDNFFQYRRAYVALSSRFPRPPPLFQLSVAASFGYLFSRELTPLSALFAVVDFHVCGVTHSLLSTGLPTLDSEDGRFLTQ
jgi:hypothetical protein